MCSNPQCKKQCRCRSQKQVLRNKLVLGGGAHLGLAHPGAVQFLDDQGVDTRDACDVVGISVGAIYGILHVNGYSPEEISEILELEMRFLNLSALPTMLKGAIPPLNPLEWLRRPGLFDPLTLTRRWAKRYRFEPKENLEVHGYDPKTQRVVKFRGTNWDTVEGIAAAIAVPVLFRPVRRTFYGSRGITLIDGGFKHPHPAHGPEQPTIVLKCFHGTLVDAVWPDRPGTYPVNIGDMRMLPFGHMSKEKAARQFERGYRIAAETLGGEDGPIARGEFVMAR